VQYIAHFLVMLTVRAFFASECALFEQGFALFNAKRESELH